MSVQLLSLLLSMDSKRTRNANKVVIKNIHATTNDGTRWGRNRDPATK
jgi:hypothetical protein